MNALGLILFLACAIALVTAPRKWAPLPLLVGCCFITTGQALEIGSANLPVYRLLLLTATIRIIARREQAPGPRTTADKLMLAWCAWTLFASLFQPWEPGSGPKYVSGSILNVATCYFVFRSFCRDLEDVHRLFKMICLVLLPVAAAMAYENLARDNLFSALGRVPEMPLIRDGRIRAQGPFSHPILAGTIGATCLPFAVALWSRQRHVALLGLGACLLMIGASASSGPIMSLLFGLFALWMWPRRGYCRLLRRLAVAAYLGLMVVMTQPPYFLIARIDLTGSSTGWHRAQLIRQALAHFSEWAFCGTDKTRHWMPNQGAISATQTDITNYYIAFAVLGGLLCMALMIAMLWRAFKSVGDYARHPATTNADAFTVWCLGASLFSSAASGLSVAFFGQSMVFFWMPIGLVASLHATLSTPARAAVKPSRPAAASRPVRIGPAVFTPSSVPQIHES